MVKKLIIVSWVSVLLSVSSSMIGMSPEYRSQLIADMFDAAAAGDMKALDQAVKKDPTIVNEPVVDWEGHSGVVLQTAVRRKDTKMVSYLFSKGARWDADSYSGHIALIVASGFSAEMMDCFIKAGMPIDHKFEDRTVLHEASMAGRVDMIKYLLKEGASWKLPQSGSGLIAPFLAVMSGNIGAVDAFLQQDPEIIMMQIRRQDGTGTYMFGLAMASRDEKMVEYLLKKGGGSCASAHGWERFLEEASAWGNSRVVNLIQKYKARSKEGDARSRGGARQERLRALLIDRKTGATVKEQEVLGSPAQPQRQMQQYLAAEQPAEDVKKKKKKNKKKKKAVQEDDGGPELGQDSQLGMNAAERDLALLEEESDGAGWERCAQWLEQEEQERLAQKRQEQELEQLAQKEKIKKDKSAGLVAALQAFSESNTPATRLKVRNLLENGYDLYGQDAKEYALEYDNAYSVLYPETAKQRRVKAVPTSASSAKQLKSKNTNSGAQKNSGQKNHGQSRGAGRKANKQEKKSHIPRQWAPSEPLPKAAPSVYDRLQYAAGYVEDTGEPKQQTGDYALEEDVNGIADGGEAQDDSYAQDSNYIQDGGAGDVYHLAANYDQGGAYKKIGYGKDTLWVNMRHILDGDEHGGGHFDNEDKSCFPSWVKKDFEGRVERAIHNLDYRGTDIRGRDCVVGSFAPEQAGEVPVPFKGRMVTIYGYVVSDPETGEETLIEDRNGQPIAVLGTLYWISPSKYARLVGHAQGIEEKDDGAWGD